MSCPPCKLNRFRVQVPYIRRRCAYIITKFKIYITQASVNISKVQTKRRQVKDMSSVLQKTVRELEEGPSNPKRLRRDIQGPVLYAKGILESIKECQVLVLDKDPFVSKPGNSAIAVVDEYDNEGYGSMNQDTKRNIYFIRAIIALRNDGVKGFLEIGPGADAFLTKTAILNTNNSEVRLDVLQDSRVLAIEANKNSFEKATQVLRKRGYGERATVLLTESNEETLEYIESKKLAEKRDWPEAFVAEIIGFIASLEGQCTILRTLSSVLHGVQHFVPRLFGTFLSPCTMTLTEEMQSLDHWRVPNRHAGGNALPRESVSTHQPFVLEWWDSVDHEQWKEGKAVCFTSSTTLPAGTTCLAGSIVLSQDPGLEDWCTSAIWAESNALKAKSWDLAVFKLPYPISKDERATVISVVQPFLGNPTYRITLEVDDERVMDRVFDTDTLIGETFPRI